MAETTCISYDSTRRRDEEKEKEEEDETFKNLREYTVTEREKKTSKCESCVRESRFESTAVFLCFVCEMYVCVECMNKHRSHEGINVWKKESEKQKECGDSKTMGKPNGNEKKKSKTQVVWEKIKTFGKKFGKNPDIERENGREESEGDRMREEKKRKKMLEIFFDKLMHESEIKRRKELKNNHPIICDRVWVKHELDRWDCRITGLCGLEGKRWVACDFRNCCIKIFKLGSHMLERYIWFVGSGSWPRGVTEIHLEKNSAETSFVSNSSSGISGTDPAEPDKQSLIAVTFPRKRQIMVIDLSKKPAKLQKTIFTEEPCISLKFNDDKIFAVCRQYSHDSPHSVYVKSTDGDTLNRFYTGIDRNPGPSLAVNSGRVYLTNYHKNKVQCRNVEGQLISEILIEGSEPPGISVDRDNKVYVCAWGHNKVYKLESDLTRYRSVLDQTADFIEVPEALCNYKDKLFVCHYWRTSLRNFVTVVRLF